MAEGSDQDEIIRLLDWYQSTGVDTALDGVPVDWIAHGPAAPGANFIWPDRAATPSASAAAFGQPTADVVAEPVASRALAQPPPASPKPIGLRPQTPLGARDAGSEARRAAESAHTLDALEAALRSFNGCSLKATATNLCFYRGTTNARVMIIGEAPGREEDLEGKPFVGKAGQLLDKMLAAISLTEADVHITNVVYWRPPGNRTPTPQETLACRPFLDRQIALVNPDFVVALGGSAAKELFGIAEGIMRLRGKWRTLKVGDRDIPALATLHPAYLLRTPAAKNLVWQDLLQISRKLRTS